jgi:hypothetical protein
MSEVSVNRFETQYRLPPAAFAEQGRLDQVRTAVLDKAFRKALAMNGIGADAEICIRSLVSTVCLRLDRSGESITVSWSEAIAYEINRALRDHADRNVVFYHSRRQAMWDFAVGVARGDLKRAWAWRQLGLWRSRSVRSGAQAMIELTDALAAEPVLLVPTLQALAEAGWLQPIASRITEAQWVALAAAALSGSARVHLIDESSDSPSPHSVRNALRVLARSKLARTISSTSLLENAAITTRRAVAILALLEAEPILISADLASATIGMIAEAIQSARNEPIISLVQSNATGLSRDTIDQAPTAVPRSSTVTSEHDAAAEKSTIAGLESIEAVNRAVEPIDSPSDLLTDLPIDLRRRSLTRFGGLLFLIGIIDELNLPEEISGHELLGARPFVWVMHQLAMALVTAEPDDPAALAFAGLLPKTTPPSEDELPATELEVIAIAGYAERIVARLRLVLERPDEAAETLLEFACSRRAEVVADPGWIELKFSLDDVSTEIRRAGLDLDPGYVPWLGVVLRFTYE